MPPQETVDVDDCDGAQAQDESGQHQKEPNEFDPIHSGPIVAHRATLLLSVPWCVYLVRCKDGSLYTGIAKDVAARVARHNAGTGAKYTRSRLPVTLAYEKKMKNETAARKREAAIKRLTKAEKEALLP